MHFGKWDRRTVVRWFLLDSWNIALLNCDDHNYHLEPAYFNGNSLDDFIELLLVINHETICLLCAEGAWLLGMSRQLLICSIYDLGYVSDSEKLVIILFHVKNQFVVAIIEEQKWKGLVSKREHVFCMYWKKIQFAFAYKFAICGCWIY